MLRTLIIAALVATPSLAFAQAQTTTETAARCLLGSKTFSPGATIRASSGVNVCNPDGTWAVTDKPAAGCFFADAFYSVGATSSVSGNKAVTATCNPDGSWSTAAAPAAG